MLNSELWLSKERWARSEGREENMYKGFEVAISLVQLENLRRLGSNQAKYQTKLVMQASRQVVLP